MYVKPTPGSTVPDPQRGGSLPPEGRNVDVDQYWLKRIAEGHVVEFVPRPQPDATQAKQE